jgi:hypothetical protein
MKIAVSLTLILSETSFAKISQVPGKDLERRQIEAELAAFPSELPVKDFNQTCFIQDDVKKLSKKIAGCEIDIKNVDVYKNALEKCKNEIKEEPSFYTKPMFVAPLVFLLTVLASGYVRGQK